MSYHLFSHVHAITIVRHEQRKTWKFVLQEKRRALINQSFNTKKFPLFFNRGTKCSLHVWFFLISLSALDHRQNKMMYLYFRKPKCRVILFD